MKDGKKVKTAVTVAQFFLLWHCGDHANGICAYKHFNPTAFYVPPKPEDDATTELKFAYNAARSQKARFSKWKSLYGKWMEKAIEDEDCYSQSPSSAGATKMFAAASAAMKKLIPTGKYSTTFENMNPATFYGKLQSLKMPKKK